MNKYDWLYDSDLCWQDVIDLDDDENMDLEKKYECKKCNDRGCNCCLMLEY